MPFSKLGLAKPILEGVRAMGWTDPTPIQLRAIPLMLEGRDVIGSAQTGTGKTGAFSLPFLSKLGKRHGKTRVLILEPTRELASQVETAIRDYARFTDLTVAVIYGGVGYGKQVDALKNGVDIIVATPGRLLDHMRQRVAKLDDIQYAVLDEADFRAVVREPEGGARPVAQDRGRARKIQARRGPGAVNAPMRA